ncbi:MAG: hypothetical protein KJ995_02000 [Candidatus Omnitrophica bacterium]|nr:hypothetical protein [Candidatus Omnitrophota bacterium]MBU1128043.1 hypothetical protein [Candidatus Omnitrophota bacterium]MBU1657370.1 hypothetical protein [Candidatus Omnitrophota bacterium]MBU1851164.1 hypothetical protein [Candidatus Omnitrophota bacterium]
MEEKLRAEIDGKEIEVEFAEGGAEQEAWTGKAPGTRRLFFPVVITTLAVVLIVILSVTLFIWVLPILLPILIIWFIVKLLK